MPATQGEKLYGLPGPQNSAVLMDIISKLKQDLQHSRSENTKLVDQLNCLISLVKRAWSGEQGAIIHLANIVGVEAPNFMVDMNRNTPVPDKTRAVRNWERLSIRLLEHEYAAIQKEIKERQRQFLQNRQQYMAEVMEDHQREMSKFALHKNTTTNVEDVDKKFIRCFSAKTRKEQNKIRPTLNRPRTAFRSKHYTAADMVEKAEVTVADLVGQQPSQISLQHNQNATDSTFKGLYRLSSLEDKGPFRPHEQFDDPNRYKQNNLFDPDVIFSAQMMSKGTTDRPSSATNKQIKPKTSLGNRPKSAVFITESKPDRPLKYETTRPVSGKTRPVGSASLRGRRNSAPTRAPVPTSASKKELHKRSANPLPQNGHQEHQAVSDTESREGAEFENQSDDDVISDPMSSPQSPKEKPPISVKVRTNDPVDKFVEDLKLMNEMEDEFKKSTLQLQKKLGLDREGFVF